MGLHYVEPRNRNKISALQLLIEDFRCTRAPNYSWKLSNTLRGICLGLTTRQSVVLGPPILYL